MEDRVKEKLRELINTQGQQVLLDPTKFTSLMLDLCLNTNEREINILATALTNKIPQHLQSSGSTSLTDELSSSLSHRLENETGLSTDAANWAVNTWAEALGMVTVEYFRPKDAGKQVPPPELKTTIQTPPEVGPLETPVIGVDCTVLDFGKVTLGTRSSKIFKVRNLGTGTLMGKVNATEPWIEVSPQIFDVPSVGQSIIVTVNSSVLLPEKHTTGYINFESNGGTAKIEIKAAAASKSKRGLKAWIIAAGITGMLIIIGIAMLIATNILSVTSSAGSVNQSVKVKIIESPNVNGNSSGAISTVNTASVASLVQSGFDHETKGEYEEAIVDFNKAIELDPSSINFTSRGVIYNKKGEFDKAILDFTKAIELNPRNASLYKLRGLVYWDKAKYDEAIDDYDIATKIDPKINMANTGPTYMQRGLMLANNDEYDKAIADFSKAMEVDPTGTNINLIMAYYNRGYSYGIKGSQTGSSADADKAILDFTKAIELAPTFADAYNNRGAIYYKLKGDVGRASADLQKAKELGYVPPPPQ
jgi:Flp pilus assembly protein TadD